jgi:hypothetical protein
MQGRWFITPHAVRQYIARVRACSYDEALADLIRITASARADAREASASSWAPEKVTSPRC